MGEQRGLGAVVTKGCEQTFDDGYVHYLYHCDSFVSIYTYENVLNCILHILQFLAC